MKLKRYIWGDHLREIELNLSKEMWRPSFSWCSPAFFFNLFSPPFPSTVFRLSPSLLKCIFSMRSAPMILLKLSHFHNFQIALSLCCFILSHKTEGHLFYYKAYLFSFLLISLPQSVSLLRTGSVAYIAYCGIPSACPWLPWGSH